MTFVWTWRRWAIPVAVVVLAAVVAFALVWRGRVERRHEVGLDSLPPAVAEQYQFVRSHHDVFEHIPCYCGCGETVGHNSLYACFINASGGWAEHASGCQVCRDEARDTEAFLAQGKSTGDIRAYVDAQYGELGRPTDTR